jgi:hypothetical protein
MYSVAVHRLIVVSSSCYLLLCTSYVPLLFYLSNLIEDTAAAAKYVILLPRPAVIPVLHHPYLIVV